MSNTVTPKLSLLLVTYNHEAYIRQALASVMMQRTDFDFEIVVADDHSQDSTLAIIEEDVADKHSLRVLPSERNVGITRNYQRGFAACRGEYIAVLEGDDFWISPAKLQSSVAFLDQHPECPFCFHRFLRYDETSSRFSVNPPLEIGEEFALYTAAHLASDNFIGNFSTCVYRRECIEKLDPGLFEMKVYDWMLNITVAQSGMIGYLPAIMSIYRIHPSGTWSGKTSDEHRPELLELIDTYNKYLDFKFDSEFQVFKSAQLAEAIPEAIPEVIQTTNVGRPSEPRRLWSQIKQFVPPALATRVKRVYQRIPPPAGPVMVPDAEEGTSFGPSSAVRHRSALPSADDPEEDRLDPIRFTAHNIKLDSGECTNPDLGAVMSQYPWFVSARKVLSLVFPEDKTPYSVVDLGCLEGGYAVEFARMGFGCLGIEIRKSNFAACQYVRARVNLPHLSFVQDDVWNVANYGCFDAAFCCGILYHLERPRAFLQLLSKVTKRVVIIQTHFATERKTNEFHLSNLTEWEGATGRWYPEPAPSAEAGDRDRWSAWENQKSFWLTRPWILQSLYDVGFDLVFEQFDSLAPSIATDMVAGYYHKQDRGTFVGVRTGRLR